ncbi:hypothetical protein [Aliiglaciecola lipolytica]|uniref:DUF4234 domain-containing protein n=1 Tax=Aliiglaciecola lipolytica E3 TaxID=1127673 RepID=K6XM95_9ALTE|nr:hypothetical protein [Aliiglaciecola lipolytica]GAC12781.1 hypothetical protein GLIP_0126 [Aliiglaciecola lipolytica E3]
MSLNQTSENSLYAAPKSDLGNIESHEALDQKPFYVVAKTKLIILSVFTLNLYLVFWFFRNWRLQKVNADYPCIPILRAIFNIFFIHALYAQVQDALESKKIERNVSGGMASLYVITVIINALTNRWEPSVDQLTIYIIVFVAILVLQLLPIWYVQDRINQVCDDPEGHQNASFSIFNWCFILLGTAFWGLMLFGIFAPLILN